MSCCNTSSSLSALFFVVVSSSCTNLRSSAASALFRWIRGCCPSSSCGCCCCAPEDGDSKSSSACNRSARLGVDVRLLLLSPFRLFESLTLGIGCHRRRQGGGLRGHDGGFVGTTTTTQLIGLAYRSALLPYYCSRLSSRRVDDERRVRKSGNSFRCRRYVVSREPLSRTFGKTARRFTRAMGSERFTASPHFIRKVKSRRTRLVKRDEERRETDPENKVRHEDGQEEIQLSFLLIGMKSHRKENQGETVLSSSVTPRSVSSIG